MEQIYYFRLVTPEAIPPIRATNGSAGYDISSLTSGWVWPFRARLFETGLQFFMRPDQNFFCQNRSSVFKRGLIVNNSPCDSDYRWTHDKDGFLEPLTWKLLVRNVTLLPIKVAKGDRLAQIVLPNDGYFDWVTNHPGAYNLINGIGWGDAGRNGGLGSTGK